MGERVIISFAPGTAEARHHVINLLTHNENEATHDGGSMAIIGVPLKTFLVYSDAEEFVGNNR